MTGAGGSLAAAGSARARRCRRRRGLRPRPNSARSGSSPRAPSSRPTKRSPRRSPPTGATCAFQGTIGGLKGVFRKDLQSGPLTPVAAGSAYEADAPAADAERPLDLRRRPLRRLHHQSASSTRSTTRSRSRATSTSPTWHSSPPAYELASALDGCDPASRPCGLTYEGSGGSEASGGVALSADGRRVAFVTTAPSDLTSGPAAAPKGRRRRPARSLLRDLDSDRTTLVSAARDAGSGAMSDPRAGARRRADRQAAAAAAEGGGAQRRRDHRRLARRPPAGAGAAARRRGERRSPKRDSAGAFPYDEPLWRRVADGPAAPTRRIVGGGDPLAPGCPGRAVRSPNPPARDPSRHRRQEHRPQLGRAAGWGCRGSTACRELSADGRTVGLDRQPDRSDQRLRRRHGRRARAAARRCAS